ncbi:hypothetical protein C1645_860121 [Glomus cerebriforme]|uniref:Myb/SANT-like DNA-binding domain-containing protein n=1 Tax=Glomus cerebriforme TaxID=658196 RepID=A0A397SEC0_9GLOM|nr:hypothetical protein C1645_860121 [Glomus cerebriforme]
MAEWTDPLIHTLIDECRTRNDEFHDLRRNRERFWGTIASKINQKNGTSFSGHQCKEKFSNLVRNYNIMCDFMSGKSKARSRTGARYFDEFCTHFWKRAEDEFDRVRGINTFNKRRNRGSGNITPAPSTRKVERELRSSKRRLSRSPSISRSQSLPSPPGSDILILISKAGGQNHNQMRDKEIAHFWKAQENIEMMKMCVEMAQIERMLQSVRKTTDGALTVIEITNELHRQNLLSMFLDNKSTEILKRRHTPYEFDDDDDTDKENDKDLASAIEEDSIKNDSTEDNHHPKVNKVAFRKAYNLIPNDSKLQLRTGKIVEDVLFNYVKDIDDEHEMEWEELTVDRLGVPSIPQDIAKELARYGKKSLGKLRKIVTTPYLQDGVTYDVQQHYDLEWIQLAVRALVNLYENTDSPLVRNQYEDWFTVALFGACIDTCMRNAQLSTDVNRTDVPSLSSANRKNHAQPNSARKLIGRKIDGIIYVVNRLLEVGAIEAARSFFRESDRKCLIENFKMLKTLHDMLAEHIRAVDYDDKKIKKLQVFGILHLGQGCGVPVDKKFSVEGIKTFLKFLASIYQHKVIIRNNLNVLNNSDNDVLESNEDDLYNELIEIGRPSTPPPSSQSVRYFADCWKTPRKVKPKKKRKLE